jgi:hypothetical protein
MAELPKALWLNCRSSLGLLQPDFVIQLGVAVLDDSSLVVVSGV